MAQAADLHEYMIDAFPSDDDYRLCVHDEHGNIIARCASEGAAAEIVEALSRQEGPSLIVRALEEFRDDIERTGGLVYRPDGILAPAGDPSWVDLGSTYQLACEALGVEPMIDVEPCTEEVHES